MKKTCAIIIMDGYGLAPAGKGNAISMDGSKNVNAYRAEYPSATLGASGRSAIPKSGISTWARDASSTRI